MRFVIAAFVLALAVLAGCTAAKETADGGSPGDSSVEGDGGGVLPDGGMGDACPLLPTDEELLKIEQDVRAALALTAEDLAGCSTDADCMNADVRADCIRGCCVSINKASEDDYRFQEQLVADEYCTAHVDGCPLPVNNGDCDCTNVQCLERKCVNPGTPGVHRVPVEGTVGFCASYGYANTTCQTVDDCVAYRVHVEADCCTGVVKEPDCAIVNKYGIAPGQPACATDLACDSYPRDCVGGQCVFAIPARTCADSSECQKVDTACGCIAANASAVTAALIFGSACEPGVACADAEAVCVKETCRLVGAFMDEQIDLFCRKAGDCGLLGEFTVAECAQMYTKDNYAGAADQWTVISVARIIETTCGGNGPWHHLVRCPYTTICP